MQRSVVRRLPARRSPTLRRSGVARRPTRHAQKASDRKVFVGPRRGRPGGGATVGAIAAIRASCGAQAVVDLGPAPRQSHVEARTPSAAGDLGVSTSAGRGRRGPQIAGFRLEEAAEATHRDPVSPRRGRRSVGRARGVDACVGGSRRIRRRRGPYGRRRLRRGGAPLQLAAIAHGRSGGSSSVT